MSDERPVRHRRWASMRGRIVAQAVLAAVVATTLFGLPLGYGVAQSFLGDEQSELERIADVDAVSVAFDVAAGRTPTGLGDGQGRDSTVLVAFYGTDGQLVAGDGPRRLDPASADALGDGRVSTANDIDGQLVVAVPVVDGDTTRGVVRAATDYSAARWRIVATWAGMLALAAAAIGITWLLARRQAARLAHPLESLAVAAQQLGEGDFSSRTARSGIVEIDAAGSALDTTAGRLGALVTRERAFSADASHQLRTPLTGLRLSLETALELPPEAHRGAIENALASADRLEATITDLLALARDTGAHGTPLDPTQLIADVQATWGPLLARHDRDLAIHAEDDLPGTAASAAAVRQVVGVLVDNATVHGAGTVTVSVRDAGGVLAVDVADEGTTRLEVDRLFIRSAHRDGGHGIGLALARTLAEAEGGRLRVASPLPPVFTLLLPPQPGVEDS
ncbi:HAMP domain-containing sensor histidine kinase [Klenkia sp. PcliD-1-E]|uniref:sensor histidine kinase n=1 Tax=Klenkia sp. PcliD-1-E TaxID=2954492 RepID=UPI00209755F2|nr:HAMP domain-containing sensor histidine kinase [Klenkia sp. PcliD-1-E]MCO7220050.1 HAMP domain-containing histidine kinase [Klenkia sp. PcliD-1-E]